MRRKIIALITAAVLLATMLITAIPALAASSTSFKMSADKTTAVAGDKITFTVSLGAVENIAGTKFKLSIPEGLTYVANSGTEASGIQATLNAAKAEFTESTKVFVIGSSNYTSASDTVLMTFECTVDSGTSGLKTVDFIIDDPDNIFDTNGDNISFITTPAKINVVIPATGVSLNKKTLSLVDGANETLVATVSPTNSTDTVSWKSSNTSIATVDSNGKIEALKIGTATITATAGNFSDTCELTVTCSHSGKAFHEANTNATCQEQNYSAYYLCTCGKYFAENGTSEISGIPYTGVGSHSFGNDWDKASSTETKHYHKCSVCGELDAGQNHVVGTAANCKDKAVCLECDKSYGSTNASNHKTPDVTKYVPIDENDHKKVYDCCGATIIASEPHVYDNGDDMICNDCSYDKTHYCGNGTLKNGFAADCSTMTNGQKDYYECSCGLKYFDATCLSAVNNDSDLVITAEHNLTHHNADPANCWENGTVEYWSCSKCNKNFGTSNKQDTAALATIVDPATGNHDFGTDWVDGGDGYHYHVCTTEGCAAKEESTEQEHIGGTATCQAAKVCSECEASYGDKDAENHTSEEFLFVDNGDGTHSKTHKCCKAVIGEAEKHEFGDDNICDICEYIEPIVYPVVEGEKQTVESGKDATFKMDVDFALFEDGGSVKVDGKVVDPKNYTAVSGSTIITLKADYLATLGAGEHTLEVLFKNNGSATTTFTTKAAVDTDNKSPATGDTNNITLWFALAFVSLASLTGITVYTRRKRNQA